MPPRIEQGPREQPEASPLWPLVLVLADIASRIDRQEAEPQMLSTADRRIHAELSFSIVLGGHHEEDRL